MTLTGGSHEDRLVALQRALVDADLPALVVTDLSSVRWLTGFGGSAGRVYVPAAGEPRLITDGRYVERAGREVPTMPVVADRTWGWLADAHPADRPLAVEADVLPWAEVRVLQDLGVTTDLVPTAGLLRSLRAVKDDAEVDTLRRACELTVAAFDRLLGWLRPELTERQVSSQILALLRDVGADGSAFAPIVAGGPNGSVPHHAATDRPLQKGDLLTVDFGALVDGYHADMTRTVAIGPPELALRRIHELVRTAQQAGVEAVAAGVATTAVDRACRQVITDAGHGPDFLHGTGHGVGLDIHEEPFLGPASAGTLHERMTITVEPGVYIPGLGGVRIEDVVLVHPAAGERLTTADHDLIIV